ncbi:MAG: winged helix-turn-helix transcriptional regulator, partial [Paludibacteraceae bacterium]|nr:winged helix-turn-helix transcriptional regulator [Paludibacteraceae bacterium]
KMGKEDRRANIISLTAKANALKPKVQEATAEALQDGFAGLSEKDVLEVQRLMKIIFSNISKYADSSY